MIIVWFTIQGWSQASGQEKFIVAEVVKTCGNNYSVIYTNCENETTLFPGSVVNHTLTTLSPSHECLIQMEFPLMEGQYE